MIELIAVLAILSLITAGAVLAVRGPLAANRIDRDIEQVLLTDRIARSESRRFHRSQSLIFEQHGDAGFELRREPSTGDLRGTKCEIACLTEIRSDSKRNGQREAQIVVDASGRSATYAMKFEDTGKVERWLVIAGETGQPIEGLDGQQVDDLLRTLADAQ